MSTLTGEVTSYGGAVAVRFFLGALSSATEFADRAGFVEAAFFPGALFLLSRWVRRRLYAPAQFPVHEEGARSAHRPALQCATVAESSLTLAAGSIASNAINGLIAAGILGNMQGVLGHAAW